jgi:tetratricopeptide (TPR) repeat protein
MIATSRSFLSAVCTTLLLASSAASLRAESTEDILKQANTFDVQLRASEALQLYQQAEKQDPKNADILVRIARQYRHLMADADSKNEKLRLGNLALEYGRRAASLAPKNSDAQLSTAISQGKMLSLLSSRDQLEASRQIKAAADKAIRLNPNNDLAWHIEGRWNRVLADINPIKRAIAAMIYDKVNDASNEDAVVCFQKAIRINPNRCMHYIELGRAYSQMGKTDEARLYLKKGLAMPSLEKDDPECKAMGREVLAQLN